MDNCCCDPLALTMAINTLAVALAKDLSEEDLALLIVVLGQLGSTLSTIAVQRSLCKES